MDEEAWLLRRRAVPAVLILAILLGVLRFTVWNNNDSTAKIIAAILDNTIAAMTGALTISLYLFYIRYYRGRSEAFFLRGRELKNAILSDAQKSHTWRIRARTGSFFVRETLATLPEDAVVDIILMDPSHADDLLIYQTAKPPEERSSWDPGRIQADIIVSIIRAVQYKARNRFMSISLHTTRSMWGSQSLDISDKHSFLCGQSKNDVAIVVPEKDPIYQRFLDDFSVVKSMAESRTIPAVSLPPGEPNAPITEAIVATLAPAFKEWFDIEITEPDLQALVIERSSREHHYGR